MRCGYPINRVRDIDTAPVVKKMAYGRILDRFKLGENGKKLVLHATKGWRVY